MLLMLESLSYDPLIDECVERCSMVHVWIIPGHSYYLLFTYDYHLSLICMKSKP